MQRGITGHYEVTNIGGEDIRAFIPNSLPPNPPLEISHGQYQLLERATLALGRLDSITLLLPDGSPCHARVVWASYWSFRILWSYQLRTGAVPKMASKDSSSSSEAI